MTRMLQESLQDIREQLALLLKKQDGVAADKIRWILSPYRICPLGAHVDHQGGAVLGMTIELYTLLAFAPLNAPEVRLHSLNYDRPARFALPVPRQPVDGWWRYAAGAAYALQQKHQLRRGLVGAVWGALPGGGLSSSASVGLAYLLALADSNGLELESRELVELDRILENEFLGLKNGILDQTSIVYGRERKLLYIDTRHFRVTPIALPENHPSFKFLILYSGISRELTGTGFNQRVQECHEAAQRLAELSSSGAYTLLGEVPRAVFEQYADRLPEPLRKRAKHFFAETERVEKGRALWQVGDLQAFGRLMNASCRSSIEQYESGSEPLRVLWQLLTERDGVYGSRFSGGGFGGCVIALVQADQAEAIGRSVLEPYLQRFPELKGKARFIITETDDGLRRL
ncbi:MAG: galactokinase family protein [candidate division KSB1 bacterium]|nr:galactokinase family protein [candidate division KSB1 bacterium]